MVNFHEKHANWRRHDAPSVGDFNPPALTSRVSVKRRHSVFDAQNFGQNAQKRKTVRQVTQRICR